MAKHREMSGESMLKHIEKGMVLCLMIFLVVLAVIFIWDDGRVYVAQGYGSRVQVFNIRDTKAE